MNLKFYQSKLFDPVTAFVLFIITFFVHQLNLWTEPFWYDEIVSVKSTLFQFGHIKHISEWDNNPPFYYYCLWIWEKLFGISEYHIRLFNVLIHSFSVMVLYLLVKKQAGFASALFSALFLLLHNFGIEYSHEARCYSLVLLLVLLSTFYFFKLLKDPKMSTAIVLGILNFLVIYTHYIAGIALFIQSVFVFLFYKNTLKFYTLNWIVLIVLVALRFTKKQFLLILAFNSSDKAFWLQKSDINLLSETLTQLYSNGFLWIPLIILAMCSAALVVFEYKKEPSPVNIFKLYSVLLCFGSIVVIYLAGKITPIFLGRYLLFTIPFTGILLSALINKLNTKLQYPSMFIVIALMLFNINTNPGKNMDYKLAVYVTQYLQKNDCPVIIQTKDVAALYAYYYKTETFSDYQNTLKLLHQKNIFEIENHADFEQLKLNHSKRMVLCQSFENPEEHQKILASLTNQGYTYATTRSVKGVRISLFTQ